MKILELIIKNFGKCAEERFRFQDGINVIYGENESGKTTVHTCIKALLFGLERGRGRASQTDTYSRYEPWENPGFYAGILRFECGGRTFRLERSFGKYTRKAELICEDDGEELSLEHGDLDMLLGGMSASTYENTIAVGQLKARTDQTLATELKNYAANYYVAGNSELDLTCALNMLRDKLKLLEKEEKEELQNKERERDKLEQEASYVWRDIHGLEESLESVQKAIDDAQWMEQERREEEQHRQEILENEEQESKWRVHPVELAEMLAAVVLCFVFISRPWNYLIGIVVMLAAGLYIWNRMKDGKKRKSGETINVPVEAGEILLEKLQWEEDRLKDFLRERQMIQSNLIEQMQELEGITESGSERGKKRKALELALSRMRELSGEIRNELSQDLNGKVSEILCEMTEGKYGRVLIDEDLRIFLYTEGKRIAVEQVSQGTVEQVYLALRMAAAEILSEEEYPVVLDDTFVFYDDRRLASTLSWFAGHKKQVLLFTCQKREAEALESLQEPYTKWSLCCGTF